MVKIKVKTKKEIKIMAEGGKRLGRVKHGLRDAIGVGVSAYDIEELANKLIKREKGEASFKMVEGYSWATCVNVNSGVVHGIPKKSVIFKKGDLVSVDVGLFYKGFHTDTSFSVGLDVKLEITSFLGAGKKALTRGISQAKPGNRIYDISEAIENTLESKNYSPIRALVGHGVGRQLHEEPQIPCFTDGKKEESPVIPQGAVLAVEVMYAMGGYRVQIDEDGWTISSSDGTITGLFEETIAVTQKGPLILTE